MTKLDHCETKLWDALGADRLVDFSQFHKSHFFDEVPLFSRESQIDFLAEYGADRADAVLLEFALKFFKSVVSYEEHRAPYFAAVTVWSSSGADRIIPNLFVWSGPVARLRKTLALNAVSTPFGKKIRRFVSQAKVRDEFEVLEDLSTDPNEPRVFISFSQPPYKNFVSLGNFRRPASRAT